MNHMTNGKTCRTGSAGNTIPAAEQQASPGRRRLMAALAGSALLALTACNAWSQFGEAAPVKLNAAQADEPLAKAPSDATLVLAGGCFWGVQAVFQHVSGVTRAISGYAGGERATAQYNVVSSGLTGHAESVEIHYDPSRITVGELLRVFFSVAHDPTEVNRQGPDTGSQYRSAVFYANDGQKAVAQAYIDQLNRQRVFAAPIATQLAPLRAFYPAEAYHQDYATIHPENGYIRRFDLPKLANLKSFFPQYYREAPVQVSAR